MDALNTLTNAAMSVKPGGKAEVGSNVITDACRETATPAHLLVKEIEDRWNVAMVYDQYSNRWYITPKPTIQVVGIDGQPQQREVSDGTPVLKVGESGYYRAPDGAIHMIAERD